MSTISHCTPVPMCANMYTTILAINKTENVYNINMEFPIKTEVFNYSASKGCFKMLDALSYKLLYKTSHKPTGWF